MKRVMKKILLSLIALMGSLAAQADTTYPYLTFELTDGSKASVAISSDISLTFSGTTLTIGQEAFELTNLSKMYFSTSDQTTTGISAVHAMDGDEVEAIYDLQGRQVSRSEMRRGIYIIKTKNGTSKVNVR